VAQRTARTANTSAASDRLRGEASDALAAFSRFQAAFAGMTADHGASSPLEVRLHLAETAIDVAGLGENLNLLASLLDLPERVPSISPAAVEEMAAACRALRS
jgi:hypothetical protein